MKIVLHGGHNRSMCHVAIDSLCPRPFTGSGKAGATKSLVVAASLKVGHGVIVQKSFPLPEEPPAVPMQLLDKVQDAMRENLTEVDVLLQKGGGWSVVNNVKIEEGDTPSAVAQMLKSCGDHDAETRGKSAKYRIQMWLGSSTRRDAKRRYHTFSAESSADESEVNAVRPGTEWKELYWQQSEFNDKLSALTLELVASNNARAKEDQEVIRDFNNVYRTMVGPYREGVQLKNEAITSVLRAKAEAERERSRADAAMANNDDDEFWKQMRPMFTAAMAQVMDKVGLGEMLALPAAKGDKQPAKQPAKSGKQHSKPPKQERSELKAQTVEHKEPARRPLHVLGQGLLNGLGASVLLELMRILSAEQNDALLRISKATDDQASATAILELSQSLMKQPGLLLQMQRIMGADRAQAFRQLAALAVEVSNPQH